MSDIRTEGEKIYTEEDLQSVMHFDRGFLDASLKVKDAEREAAVQQAVAEMSKVSTRVRLWATTVTGVAVNMLIWAVSAAGVCASLFGIAWCLKELVKVFRG